MNSNTRTILALFLIFGVFLAFQYFAPKSQPPKVQPKPEEVSTPVPGPAPEPARQAARIKPAATPESKGPAAVTPQELELVSDGMTARLSNLGATLTGCQLARYSGPDGKPVQLIPDGGRALGLGLNLDGRAYDLSQLPFAVAAEGAGRVVFEAVVESVLVRKTYAPLKDGLGLHLVVELEPTGSARPGPRYRLAWGCGLNSTEKDRKQDQNEFAAVAMLGKELVTDKLKKLAKPDLAEIEGNIVYSGVRTKYFLAAMVPQAGRAVSVKQGLEGQERATSTLALPVQGAVRDSFLVYLGPIEHNRLAAVHPGLDRVADTGWKWLQWISRLILAFLVAIHKLLPNYGAVIILFSALMKLVFFPLTYTGMKSMKRMQLIQPRLKKIQEQHKGDPGRMNQETMALYKKHGVNPLSGCLPLLIQMPIFFALYTVLVNTIELRQAPFMLWISDLSVKDPFYVLPILMGIAMFGQQKLTTVDPKQKMMVYIMPVFMAIIFLNMPAGLNLYWLTNNVLSIGEQYLIHVRTQPVPED